MKRWTRALLLTAVLSAGAVSADEAVIPPAGAAPSALPAPSAVPAPPAPQLRAGLESAPVTLRDNRRVTVTLRVPLALHRGANAFRLYGARPLTLHDRGRRRDLYRDAFLELATRSRLAPAASAWDSVGKQLDWLKAIRPGTAILNGAGVPPGLLPDETAKAVTELVKKASELPGYSHVTALSRSLGRAEGAIYATGEVSDTLAGALQLRALATDEAEQRLTALGNALSLDAPGGDPALRDGYRAARGEFEQVRQGLWPAVAASLRKNGGRLLLSAVREIALSHLGMWAIFGHMGWQSVENALNAEHRGQYAVCLATLATALGEAASRMADCAPLALYAEYALAHQLTEALKGGTVMPLQPAGGRSAGSWQIQLGTRCDELRKALAP